MIRDLDITRMTDAVVLAMAGGPPALYDLPRLKWLDILWEHAKESRAVVAIENQETVGVAIYALVDKVGEDDSYRIKGNGSMIWCPFAVSKKKGVLAKMIDYVKRKHPAVRELAYRRASKDKMVRRRLCHGR